MHYVKKLNAIKKLKKKEKVYYLISIKNENVINLSEKFLRYKFNRSKK